MARYKFINANPLGKLEEDCVCRAISLALNIDYNIINHKLHLIGELYDCEFLCKSCYGCLLDNVFSLDRIESFNGIPISEFVEMAPKGTFIIRVEGHLTCVIDNQIYDTWDCGNELIDTIWEV